MKTQLSNRAPSVARLVALAWAIGLLSGCEKDPLEPSFAAALTASSNLTATAASASQVNLAWQDSSPNETGFEIHRSTTGPTGSFALLAKAAANVTSYSDTGLTPLTQYCYRVRSFRTTGKKTSYSAFSNVACATTQAPPLPPAPNPPTGTDAAPSGSTRTLVTWADPVGNAATYRLERSPDAGATWTTVAMVDSTQRHWDDKSRIYYFDTALTAEQRVCYRVFAVRDALESGTSNTDCATPPAGPTSFSAVWDNTLGVVLTWIDNSAVEEGYEVWLEYLSCEDGVYRSIQVADLPPDASRFVDSPLYDACGASYYVWARKDGGTSDWAFAVAPF